jgi:hypothetical protein
MRGLGLGADIMSLGGIAIAIGAMIDAAIVMIENMHKHIERAIEGKGDGAHSITPAERWEIVVRSSKGRPIVERGGAGALLLAPNNHGLFSTRLHARSSGGTSLQTAGMDKNAGDGGSEPALDHRRAGGHGVVRARQDPPRGEEPDLPWPETTLPTGVGFCASRRL